MTSSNQENPDNKIDIRKDKNFKKNFPGTFIAFKHVIQNKKVFYDALPVVLGVRLIGNYIFGINLKLIPYRIRLKLSKEFTNQSNVDARTKKIIINNLIRGKFGKFLAAAFQVYSARDIKGQIVVLQSEEALQRSTAYNSFKNLTASKLNIVIIEKIKSISNPMNYIVAVIKNAVKKKNKRK